MSFVDEQQFAKQNERRSQIRYEGQFHGQELGEQVIISCRDEEIIQVP